MDGMGWDEEEKTDERRKVKDEVHTHTPTHTSAQQMSPVCLSVPLHAMRSLSPIIVSHLVTFCGPFHATRGTRHSLAFTHCPSLLSSLLCVSSSVAFLLRSYV